MKKYILLIISFFILNSQFIDGKISLNQKITIYYGLNDSHSRSWVQGNNDGVIGVTYFQRFENSADKGSLIYKTIHIIGQDLVTKSENDYTCDLIHFTWASPAWLGQIIGIK